MAKSQSESRLRGAFPHLSLRGAEGDEAISGIRQGEARNAWPGQKNYCFSSLRGVQNFVIARSAATKQSLNQRAAWNEAGLKIGFTE
jgi:hypothetical protein